MMIIQMFGLQKIRQHGTYKYTIERHTVGELYMYKSYAALIFLDLRKPKLILLSRSIKVSLLHLSDFSATALTKC